MRSSIADKPTHRHCSCAERVRHFVLASETVFEVTAKNHHPNVTMCFCCSVDAKGDLLRLSILMMKPAHQIFDARSRKPDQQRRRLENATTFRQRAKPKNIDSASSAPGTNEKVPARPKADEQTKRA